MVIDLSVETEKAETAETTPHTPPTSQMKLEDLIVSWCYSHLERECKWEPGEIEILNTGWLVGSRESWAYADVSFEGGQPSRSYICRSLYAADYARIESKIEEAVTAILRIDEGEEATIFYNRHYRTEIEFANGSVRYFEEGKEVEPSFSMQAHAMQITSVVRKLAAIIDKTPKGNLSDMGGKEIVARTLWEAECAQAWTRAW